LAAPRFRRRALAACSVILEAGLLAPAAGRGTLPCGIAYRAPVAACEGQVMNKAPIAATLLLLVLTACETASPTPSAARPAAAPAPAAPPDPEVDRLGLDLGIAMITQQCDDPAVQRQATRTRDAVLERTRRIAQQDARRGEEVWAEAEAVMARQARRPAAPECQRALPALREAEQTARAGRG
jgi:hypothetical protein